MNQISNYLKGAQEELRKVVWPTREETVRSTLIVIGISLVVGAFFWLFDQVLNIAVSKLI